MRTQGALVQRIVAALTLAVLGTLGLGSRPALAQERLLNMEDCFRLAIANNETFRITEEGVRRVRLLRDKAWALLLPTLRVAGTFTIYDQEIAFDFGTQHIVFQNKNAFGGVGSFSMTLFDARSIPGLQQTKIAEKSALESAEFTRADLLYEVAKAYLGVLAAQRLVEINKAAVTMNEEHLKDAKARQAAGELLKVAVTRAEIEVVKSKREVIRAENALDVSRALIAYLTGVRGSFRLARPDEPVMPAPGLEPLLEKAQHHRRDLIAAATEIDSARKNVDMAMGAYYPTLNLVASGNATQNTGFAGKIVTSQTVFTLGWTIFDGGTRYAELKEKHSLLQESILKRSQLSRSIEREVRQAFLELKSAEASLFSSKKELELAKENHAMVMARFRAGLATTIEAVDAANALATAEIGVLREQLNRDTMRVTLLRAIGSDPIAVLTPGASKVSAAARGFGARMTAFMPAPRVTR